jgi:hypothetical protein
MLRQDSNRTTDDPEKTKRQCLLCALGDCVRLVEAAVFHRVGALGAVKSSRSATYHLKEVHLVSVENRFPWSEVVSQCSLRALLPE